MHLAHSKATVGAGGDIQGDTLLSKMTKAMEVPKHLLHPGQPIATQDNILVPHGMAEDLASINDIEEQYLKTIHARYCIPRALEINISADISRYYPNKKQDPNYYEYWYQFGTPKEMFLMSRRVSVIEGVATLDIKYNVKLAREGEND